MKINLKEIIAILTAGGIITGGIVATDRLDCPYTIVLEDNEICISEEVKEAIETNLEPNSGFGGVKFGGE